MCEMLAVMAVLAVVAIIFVIPIIILVRLGGLCNGMEDLRRRMLNMERALTAQPARPPVVPPDLVAPVIAVAPAERPPLPVMQQAETLPGPAPQPVAEAAAALETPVPEPAPNAFEIAMTKLWNWLIIGEEFRKPGESWEYAAATNWLLRVGILIVLAGVAFFLKYSIEKGLMGPLGRVALSLAAGVVLIVGGVRLLFKKYHLLGQGFVGAGFVTLYFAFYAASSMYHLLPDAAAFALMACVTVAAGVMAVHYQSLPIALLGVAGGYATPAMLGSSHASAYFFYAYVLLLGVGILGISLVRRWPLLNVLGMLAAYGLAFAYCDRHHTHAQLFFDLIFLSGIHLLYLLSVIVVHLRKRVMTGLFDWSAVCLNAGLYWTWAYLLFRPVYGKEGAGLVSLAIAAVYVALVYACLRREVLDRQATTLFLALAAVFLALTPVFMLTAEWLTVAWCLQALVMLWLARRTGQTLLGYAALALFALACVRGVFFDLERLYQDSRPWRLAGAAYWQSAGVRLLTYGTLPVTLSAAWRLVRTHRHAPKILGLVLLQVWLYLTLEAGLCARVYAQGFRFGAVTVVWTLFAFALVFAGIRFRGKWMRWCGLALFALAIAKLLLADLDGLGTLYRIIAFISTGVLLVLGSFVYLRYKQVFESDTTGEA